jgi:hypothetical protein
MSNQFLPRWQQFQALLGATTKLGCNGCYPALVSSSRSIMKWPAMLRNHSVVRRLVPISQVEALFGELALPRA